MTPILEADSLSVRVGGKSLLENVSFAIEPGETVAIVGRNGAGKSTLLRALSGEIAASAGAVRLRGRSPRSYRPEILALHRAVLSQQVNVAFPFSVAEVVRMGAGNRRAPHLDSLVETALAEVGLTALHDRIIGTLSGGEQQRAHLARVLVQLACCEAEHGPGILMLDEPTASLDLCHQIDLLSIIDRCKRRGTTIISVVHDLNLAVLFAGRILALSHGRVAEDGPPQETITEGMLSRVFGVADVVRCAPPSDLPFVLPHRARKCSG